MLARTGRNRLQGGFDLAGCAGGRRTPAETLRAYVAVPLRGKGTTLHLSGQKKAAHGEVSGRSLKYDAYIRGYMPYYC